jgi:inosine-uridine nucleoside N-ribohydrolase
MLRRPALAVLAVLIAIVSSIPLGAAAAEQRPRAQAYFVDTDIGVDDAVAIAWLLRNPAANVVGFTTVAGNTSVENATQNLLTLLDAAHKTVPITIGAAAPLVYPASHAGAFVHGPTGFWFSQVHHDLNGIPRDAPAAIAAAARANPGMTLITLGPLTNVAQAAQRFPADMASVRIVALVGSRVGGNRTTVAEANAFFDPQALEVALNSHLNITLVTMELFNQIRVDTTEFPRHLARSGGPVGQLLAGALMPYFASVTHGAGGMAEIPDVAAVMLAVRPALGTASSGLAVVVTDRGFARGETVIATDPNMKVSIIADDEELSALVDRFFSDPNFDLNAAIGAILMRHPDNANITLSLDGRLMSRILERDLTRGPNDRDGYGFNE